MLAFWIHAHARGLIGVALGMAIVVLVFRLTRRADRPQRLHAPPLLHPAKSAIYTPKGFRRPRRY